MLRKNNGNFARHWMWWEKKRRERDKTFGLVESHEFSWFSWGSKNVCVLWKVRGNYGMENETKTITNSKPIYSRRSTLFWYWHFVSNLFAVKFMLLLLWKIEPATERRKKTIIDDAPPPSLSNESVNAKCYASLILANIFAICFDSLRASNVAVCVCERELDALFLHHFFVSVGLVLAWVQ